VGPVISANFSLRKWQYDGKTLLPTVDLPTLLATLKGKE
jgi:hypothetical protein